MKSRYVASLALVGAGVCGIACLVGCQSTPPVAADQPVVRPTAIAATGVLRSETANMTTVYTRKYATPSQPMQLVSVLLSHATTGTNTITVEYSRLGHTNTLYTRLYVGKTHLWLMEAPILFIGADTITVRSTRNAAAQLTLNWM